MSATACTGPCEDGSHEWSEENPPALPPKRQRINSRTPSVIATPPPSPMPPQLTVAAAAATATINCDDGLGSCGSEIGSYSSQLSAAAAVSSASGQQQQPTHDNSNNLVNTLDRLIDRSVLVVNAVDETAPVVGSKIVVTDVTNGSGFQSGITSKTTTTTTTTTTSTITPTTTTTNNSNHLSSIHANYNSNTTASTTTTASSTAIPTTTATNRITNSPATNNHAVDDMEEFEVVLRHNPKQVDIFLLFCCLLYLVCFPFRNVDFFLFGYVGYFY